MGIADRLFKKWDKNRPSGKSYDDLTDADLDAVGRLRISHHNATHPDDAAKNDLRRIFLDEPDLQGGPRGQD